MPLKLTKNEEVNITLGSTLGAFLLTTVGMSALAFKFRRRLRRLTAPSPVEIEEMVEVPSNGTQTYTNYEEEVVVPPPMSVYNTRPSVLNLTLNRARMGSQTPSSLASRATSTASLAPVRGPQWRQGGENLL